jgi:hypothetical protein
MQLKVFQMNDYDWWADYSKEEAKNNYIKWSMEQGGIPFEDIEIDICELSGEMMDKFKYVDEDENTEITFTEELRRNPKPGFFASTEH